MLDRLLFIFVLMATAVLTSNTPDASSTLRKTLDKYKNLATYHVEGTRETTVSGDAERRWEKQEFILAKAPGNRYHYDIKTPDIWNVVVADGAAKWEFQPWINEYSRRSLPESAATPNPEDEISAFMERQAQTYIDDLSAAKIQEASMLREETITIAGQDIACVVIHAAIGRSQHDPVTDQYSSQATFWIEKHNGVVRKETLTERVKYPSPLRPLREVNLETTTLYTIADLGGVPKQELFEFAPPKGASPVPRLFINDKRIDLTGFPAPPLQLRTFDGKPFDAASLKGHVVLLDFWASWCEPCVQQMRSLATIAGEHKTSLIVIGINSDDDQEAALEFLRQHKNDWTNLRDVDGQTARSWRVSGIPLVAVIGPDGVVAYYHFGYEEPEEAAISEVLARMASNNYR